MTPRFAVIDPMVAAAIEPKLGPIFRRRARDLMALDDPGSARRYSHAAAQLRASAQSFWERTSSQGSGELPQVSDGPESEAPTRWWATAVAAEKLGLKSARQVRYLARQGRLSAVIEGGRMFIDPVSVAEELERRRGDRA